MPRLAAGPNMYAQQSGPVLRLNHDERRAYLPVATPESHCNVAKFKIPRVNVFDNSARLLRHFLSLWPPPSSSLEPSASPSPEHTVTYELQALPRHTHDSTACLILQVLNPSTAFADYSPLFHCLIGSRGHKGCSRIAASSLAGGCIRCLLPILCPSTQYYSDICRSIALGNCSALSFPAAVKCTQVLCNCSYAVFYMHT